MSSSSRHHFDQAACFGTYTLRSDKIQWLSGKESACSTRDTGDEDLFPVSERSPGGGHGNPLQYSCLENPMDRGAWLATVYGVTKSQTQLSNCAHTCMDNHNLYNLRGIPDISNCILKEIVFMSAFPKECKECGNCKADLTTRQNIDFPCCFTRGQITFQKYYVSL